MNRELKFRVWDNIDYMSSPFTLHDLMFSEIEFTTDCPVMQFTGLKDKNGKEIYEGDILKNCNPESMAIHQTADVNYHSGIGGFTLVFEAIGQDKMLGMYSDIEVIGNIYENAELLNVQPNSDIKCGDGG